MRPFKALFLPDMWNDWNWFIYDARNQLIATSNRPHFHLLAAREEAEAMITGLLA
jgi:hypothetical protein